MGPQSCRSPSCWNFRTPSLGIKWHLGASPVAKHRVYYKGKGGGFPQIQVVLSFVSLCLLVVRPYTKVFQLHTNQLAVWFGRFVWVIDACHFSLSPSQSSNMPFYPQSVASQGVCPNSLLFHCCFKLTFKSIKELGSASTKVISRRHTWRTITPWLMFNNF